MPILPGLALFVILHYWSNILELVSAVWYERQLARYHNHWLLKVGELVDFTALEQPCAAFHIGSGRGHPITHPAPRLVRALLIKYLFNQSYRATEELIDNHLLVKAFVGYPLFSAPLDHSTLNRFESWVRTHQPRLFFDEIIRLVDQLCPEDRQRLHLIDTFALQARAAKTQLIELLRDLCRHLLTTLERTDPQRYTALLAHLDLAALFGIEGEKITPALNRQERAERLQLVAAQADRLLHLLSHSLDQAPILCSDQQAPLRLLLAALAKVLSDETKRDYPDPDDPTQVVVTERKPKQKGAYRIAAASDLDATYRDHGSNSPTIIGYNASVLSTTTFVRETQLDTGSQPDNVPLPQMLQTLDQQQGYQPDFLAGDMGYGHGKTRALVAEVTAGQTQLIALVPDYSKRSDLFNPTDFTLSDDGLALTCPNGKTTTSRYLTEGKGGADFRFSARACRGCPLWDRCRGPDSQKSTPRNVFISFYRQQIDDALLFNQSETFKQGIKQRMLVERIIYNLTNIHGARKAHSYGQPRTDYQLKMQATAFNLRQLVREMAKKDPAQGGVRPQAV